MADLEYVVAHQGITRNHPRPSLPLGDFCGLALLKQEPEAKVSTLFDYYALPLADWPGYPQSVTMPPHQAVVQVEAGMAAVVAASLPNLLPGRFVPYVQLFEFEALLFADPSAMAQTFGNPALQQSFASIVAACGGCEAIDDGPTTAPSKRIEALFPSYKKGGSLNAHAPLILGQIARENWQQLLGACPRFAQWLHELAK